MTEERLTPTEQALIKACFKWKCSIKNRLFNGRTNEAERELYAAVLDNLDSQLGVNRND